MREGREARRPIQTVVVDEEAHPVGNLRLLSAWSKGESDPSVPRFMTATGRRTNARNTVKFRG